MHEHAVVNALRLRSAQVFAEHLIFRVVLTAANFICTARKSSAGKPSMELTSRGTNFD